MMRYLFAAFWAGLQVGFAYLFFGVFLEPRCRKEDALSLLVPAWLATAVYGFWDTQGVHGYFMYLFAMVLLLLCVFGEAGQKGLCLLLIGFLLSYFADALTGALAEGLTGLQLSLAVTLGKLLPLGCVWLVRRSKAFGRSADVSERETLLLRQHMEMQAESIAALEQSYRLQRKSTHEFEHHLQVLRDLLDQGEAAAARDYLHQLKRDRSIQVMSVCSHHPVIDVILNQKYQTARENEIKMQIRVNDLSELAIPTDDLAVILTNLLDNAIEACRRIDGYREIFCSLLWENGLYICIRNTSEPVDIVDGRIPTSKQDSLSHGFGLMSVSYVLDQLDAEYTFRYEEGWFHFAAEVDGA